MSNLIQAARDQVAELTQNAYEKAAAAGALPAGAVVRGNVDIPKEVSHGDYASSFAMAGAKTLHMAPRAIAQGGLFPAVPFSGAACLAVPIPQGGLRPAVQTAIRLVFASFSRPAVAP